MQKEKSVLYAQSFTVYPPPCASSYSRSETKVPAHMEFPLSSEGDRQ